MDRAGDAGTGGSLPLPAIKPMARGTMGGQAATTGSQPATMGIPPTKISLWGPPNSGKTTYLAALEQAVTRADRSVGRWNIFPENEPSEKLLTDWSHRLVSNQKFPDRTGPDEAIPLKWLFVGDLTGSQYEKKRLGRRRRPGRSESRFLLDLVDVSGEAYGYDPGNANISPATQRALSHLAEADGIIYLFDPMGEREDRSAAKYVNSTLRRLSRLMRDQLVGNRLPQQISVCVTKFDHAELFFQARRLGLVNYGGDGMPRVLDEHAEQFFDSLCKGDFWSDDDMESHASAAFVRDQLHSYFHPDRIKYYVISSIGYWRPPGWNPMTSARPGFQFNPDDFANIFVDEDGERKIRGIIHPINVLEPLISLQQRIESRT